MPSMPKCKRRYCFSSSLARGYCLDHQPEARLDGYSETIRPTTEEDAIGIEIECIAPNERGVYAVVNACTKRGIKATPDGSLPLYGCELKVLTTPQQCGQIIRPLCETLRDIGCKVNEKCGLHIHLDARNWSNDAIDALLLNSWKKQEEILGIMPESRRQNPYCCRVSLPILPPRTTENTGIYQIYQLEYDQKIKHLLQHKEHYRWLGRTHKQTVEVRCHGGTLNPHKIVGWVSIWSHLKQISKLGYPFQDRVCDWIHSGPYTPFQELADEYFTFRRNNSNIE